MKRTLLLITFLLSAIAGFSQANIAVSLTDYQDTYIGGTTNTYTVSVTNFGPATATNIAVSNPIPAGVTYFSWVGSNGSSGNNVALNNTIGNLTMGSIVTYTITVEVPAAYSGNLVLQTTANSAVADPNPSNNTAVDTDTPAIGADLVVVNTNNQTVYAAGSTVVYTVTVHNNGPKTAANVQVNNAIPAGITQFSWTGNGATGTNVPLSNVITSLPAGQTITYTITVQIPATFTGNLTSTVTYSTPTTDPFPGCTECTDTDTQGFGADLVVVNSDNQTTYVAGTTNIYTVTVTNNGPAAAANVHIVNAIPAGITSFSWVGSNGTSGTDVSLDDTIATLPNGAQITYTITLDIPAGFTGNLTSQTVVTSDTSDPNPTCPACSDTDTQVTGSDLEIVNTDGNDAYLIGVNTYTVTVTNNGPFDATNVHVTNAIPAGITQFSWTGSNGTSGTNVSLDDTIAALLNGQTITYTITLTVPVTFTGNLTTTTNVTSTTIDPTPACPQCSDTDVPAVGADLVVTKTDGSPTYTAGTTTIYTILVTNNGPLPAANVVVNDIVPAGITPSTVTWVGPLGSGTGNINETFASVPVGTTLTYTVTVPIPANFDQDADLVNTVVVTSATPDPNPNCSGCTDIDTPAPSANLTVLKSDGQTQFLNDSNVTYNIIISNSGPSDAVNVSVTDALPAGITVMNWNGSNGSSGTGALQDLIPMLAVGQTATYQVTIFVPANYDITHPTLVNTVVVDAETPDPTPACPGCTDTDTPRANWVTIVPPNTYTGQQLVEDILIHSDCADVSNFVVNAGPGNAGISYFHRNNSDFPLKEGVVIVCGTAQSVAGPFAGGGASDTASGGGAMDAQLSAISVANGGTQPVSDVSAITFNFTPLTTNFSFKFLFASAEYGGFQCGYSDVFAFILTDVTDGTPYTNIANIPGTTIPVSVTTIRDNAYNAGCTSENVAFFGQYNVDNPAAAAIDLRGQTIPMIASATVIPNHNYTIKLIIGDYWDTILNSAVFIEAGSFNVGQASLTGSGPFETLTDLTIENGAAICAGLTTTIQAGASPIAGAIYEWELNDVVIPGETDYQLEVTEAGIYTVTVSIGSGASGCSQTDDIIVEFLPEINIEEPDDLFACNPFNLTDAEPGMLNGQSPAGYIFSYHHTQQEAQDVFNEILNPTNYTGFEGEIIYVAIQDLTSESGCIGVEQFALHITACGSPVTPPDLALCDDATADGFTTFDLTPQIAIALGTNDPTVFQITFHNSVADANSGASPIDPANFVNDQNCDTVWVRMENISDPTIYEITDFDVCVIPVPASPTVSDVTACDSYTLPVLPAGQSYHQNTGVGAVIPAGTVLTTSQVVAVLAESGTTPNCSSENSFVVTINVTPAAPTVADVSACDSYQLPILPAGQTYHAGTPAGAVIAAGTNITTTQTISVVAETGTTPNCSSNASFTVTINVTPLAPTPTDVTACDSYTLPALPAGQSYHQNTGAGVVIPVGTAITTTQTIAVLAETGTTPNCTSEGTFVVTINQTPAVPTVADVTACDSYQLPILPAGQTYHAGTPAGAVIAAGTNITTTQTISVVAETGTTPNCSSNASFTVTINVTPVAPTPTDVTACDSYTLPVLPAGQSYHQNTGAGAVIPAGTAITTTQTIAVLAETATTPNCTSEGTFVVTINQTPAAPTVADVSACDSYQLPILPAGQSYHAGTPAGAVIAAGTNITTTQTIAVVAETGTTPNCSSNASFTVTINVTPLAPTPTDVTACDSYTLPVLPAGQSYHQNTGAGVVIPAGTAITTTQTIAVLAETGTTPNCTSEGTFVVTINTTPQADAPANVVSCDSYTLPALTVGNYFEGPNATGTPHFAGDIISSSITLYVYAESGTTPNCFTQNSFTIGIFPIPTITAPTTLQLCDDNNDGIQCFDLTAAATQVAAGDPNLVVSFYETQTDADNGFVANQLPMNYCNILPGLQTLYIRVADVSAPQCAAFTTLLLQVNPRPIPNAVIANYELCDVNNTGDEIEGFDLTTMNSAISTQTGVVITYYENQADAIAQTSPIDTTIPYLNTAPTQQIWFNIEIPATGCFSVGSFFIVVNPLPAVVVLAPNNACSDGITNTGDFILNTNDTAAAGGVDGMIVSYYATLAQAQGGLTSDQLPNLYTSPSTTIFVRVEDAQTGCFSTTTLDLIVSQGPVANTPTPLEVCDPNNDCFAMFDLTQAYNDISGGATPAGVTITFYETQEDADNGFLENQISTNYTNISACTQIIYVRVSFDFTGCANFTQLQLIVNPTPEANANATPLQVCDDNTDGIGSFNLTLANTNILNGMDPALFTVTYHLTQANATAGLPRINNVLNYSSATTTIWVRVENNATGCFDVVELDLIVNPLPVVAIPAAAYTLCDTTNPGDQIEEFDLFSQIDLITQMQSGLIVTFHESDLEAQQGINDLPQFYTNNASSPAQTLHVRVENEQTGCFVVTTMDIRVEPLPVLVPPMPNDPLLTACDADADCFAEFDLDALITGMLQGATGIDVSFYETLENATNGDAVNALVSPYTNITPCNQTIYVRAQNQGAPGCFSIISIELTVNAAPMMPILQDIAKCDSGVNNQDGITNFDLTTQETAILAAQSGVATDYEIDYFQSLAAAENGSPMILTPWNFNNSVAFSQQIWVRIENIATGCYKIGTFTLTVNAPLALTTPTPLSMCDDGPTSTLPQVVFDLTVKNDEIVGPGNIAAGYTVAYYVSQADQQAGINAITPATAFTNTSNAQTLYVAVTGPNPTNCRSFTTLTIRVIPLPVPLLDAPELIVCDDNAPTGTEQFDLTVNETYIANGDGNMTFEYYTTYLDAQNQTNMINPPTAYEGASGIIYIRVMRTVQADYQGDFCYVIIEQQITVNPLPVLISDPYVVTECETNGDGFEIFDLSNISTTILAAPQVASDFTITYHLTASDAQSGINALPNNYQNISNPQNIYVHVVNIDTKCEIVGVVTLQVLDGATASAVDPDMFATCDDNTDGLFIFDLTQADAQVLGTQDPALFTVDYYVDAQHAADNDPIADYTNFESATTTIYAVVNNLTTGCRSDAVAISITVQALIDVIIDSDSGNTICVEYGTNSLIRGLTLSTSLDPTAYTFEWYLNGGTTPIGTGASYYAVEEGIYTLLVSSTSALGCISDPGTFTVIKSGPPSAQSPGYVITNAFGDNQIITVNVNGFGLYEYALDGGAWQSSNIFENVGPGTHYVDVRDSNTSECGPGIRIDDINAINYPHYFTPNGDGIHDTWNIIGLEDQPSAKIYIFDRYGKLLKQINPATGSAGGWDGTFTGHQMPSTDYWFTVFYNENGTNKEFKAHFSLKR